MDLTAQNDSVNHSDRQAGADRESMPGDSLPPIHLSDLIPKGSTLVPKRARDAVELPKDITRNLYRRAITDIVGWPSYETLFGWPELSEEWTPGLVETPFIRDTGNARTECVDKQLANNEGRRLRIWRGRRVVIPLRSIFCDR